MAVALEGVDLVAIALFLFLLAFLHATKYTVAPLLSALHKALGWVPFVGDLIGTAEHDIIAALNAAIGGVEEAISTLWAGFVWSLNELIDGLSVLAHLTGDAFEHAFGDAIPSALNSLWKDTERLVAQAHGAVAAARGDVVDALKQAERYAAGEASHALNLAAGYTDRKVEQATGWIGNELGDLYARLHTLEGGVAHALEQAAQTVTGASHDTVTTVTKIVEAAAAPEVAALVAAEHTVEGELPQLAGVGWDDLERILRSREFGTIAGMLGAGALVNALVHALAAETGLTNAECRAKVKQICSTDPARWAHLLEALAVVYGAFNFDELVDAIEAAAGDVVDVVSAFVGVE